MKLQVFRVFHLHNLIKTIRELRLVLGHLGILWQSAVNTIYDQLDRPDIFIEDRICEHPAHKEVSCIFALASRHREHRTLSMLTRLGDELSSHYDIGKFAVSHLFYSAVYRGSACLGPH